MKKFLLSLGLCLLFLLACIVPRTPQFTPEEAEQIVRDGRLLMKTRDRFVKKEHPYDTPTLNGRDPRLPSSIQRIHPYYVDIYASSIFIKIPGLFWEGVEIYSDDSQRPSENWGPHPRSEHLGDGLWLVDPG